MNAASPGPQPWQPRKLSSDGTQERESPVARIPDLRRIRRVPWSTVPDFAVVLAGADINGAPAPELLGFPPMNRALRDGLLSRYRFLPNHSVLIAEPASPVRAAALSSNLRTLHRQITSLREVLGDFSRERERLTGLLDGTAAADEPFWQSSRVTRPTRLIKDQYASFTVSLRPDAAVPSFLYGNVSQRITIAELLLHEMKQDRFIPSDVPVVLHIVLDVSFSMKTRGKLDYALGAVNQLGTTLPRMLGNTRVQAYVYSDTARRIDLPAERVSIPMSGTRQANVMRMVLKNQVPGFRNKILVVTDGEPEDSAEALSAADQLRRHNVDYTQVLLHHDDDLRHVLKDEFAYLGSTDGMVDDERTARLEENGADFSRARTDEEFATAVEERFRAFTRIAENAGGNQIVLTMVPALAVVSLEVYDRYLGLLTLAGA